MKKLPWTALAVIAAATTLHLAAGCGSEDAAIATDDGGDGSTGNTNDGAAGDGSAVEDGSGSLLDGQACLLLGEACGLASDCCSRTCNKIGNAAVGECAPPPDGGTCLGANADCTSSTECCTNACIGGKCSATQCKVDSPVAEGCASNAECCSGKCDLAGTRKCTPLAPGSGGGSCRTEGNTCSVNADCCSKQCGSNKRCTNISFCQQTGDVCAGDHECCGGSCDKASGATLGRCSTVGNAPCAPAGSLCTGVGCDNKCCSLSCGPLGTSGLTICQPPSGCKPQDELCRSSGDCCGGPGRPTGITSNGQPNEPIRCEVASGDTLGRCESAQCLRPGTVCKAPVGACGGTSNNCCESQFADGGSPSPSFCNSNPEACCSRDALGIPRCRAVNFVCTPGTIVPAGQLCATSADCCGQPCVNGKCAAACVARGGDCTINADCCSPEPCVVPTGQTRGTCGGTALTDGGVAPPPPDAGVTPPPGESGACTLYGQTCTRDADCCSGVPCITGRCRYP